MNTIPLESIIYIIQGVTVTFEYTAISLVLGSVLGMILGVLKYKNIANGITNIFISFIRGTPLLVQLTLVYFVLPSILGITISVFAAGIITFSINSSAYVAEIIRAGLNNVDQGQFEAAKSLGIPKYLMWKDIIFPQAIKSIFPALTNEAVCLVKETALISTIGGEDIMRRAQMIGAEFYTFLEPLFIAAASYYLLTYLIQLLSKKWEERWSYDLNTKPI